MNRTVPILNSIFTGVDPVAQDLVGACDRAVDQALKDFLPLCTGEVEFPLVRTESYKIKGDKTIRIRCEMKLVATGKDSQDFYITVIVESGCTHTSRKNPEPCNATYRLMCADDEPDPWWEYSVPDVFEESSQSALHKSREIPDDITPDEA